VDLGPGAVRVAEAVTIGRTRPELFHALRAPGTLARVVTGMEHVERLPGAGGARWALRGHLGRILALRLELAEVVSDDRIALRSLPGARTPAAASIHLADAPGGRGTEVRVVVAYRPPGGLLGRLLDRLLLPSPREVLRGALRRLQQLVETGEIATIEGQPSGRDARRGG